MTRNFRYYKCTGTTFKYARVHATPGTTSRPEFLISRSSRQYPQAHHCLLRDARRCIERFTASATNLRVVRAPRQPNATNTASCIMTVYPLTIGMPRAYLDPYGRHERRQAGQVPHPCQSVLAAVTNALVQAMAKRNPRANTVASPGIIVRIAIVVVASEDAVIHCYNRGHNTQCCLSF